MAFPAIQGAYPQSYPQDLWIEKKSLRNGGLAHLLIFHMKLDGDLAFIHKNFLMENVASRKCRIAVYGCFL